MTGAPRMVKLADLWQRKSAKGSTYFSGFMGDCQILLFKEGEKQHPTKPDETVIVWKLLVQERDPARRPPPPPRQSGEGCRGDRARRAPSEHETGRAAAWSQERSDTGLWDDTYQAVADLTGAGR